MSPSIRTTPAMLDTVLGHITPHFLAATNVDLPAARHAAHRLLAAYDTRTDAELELAADIVSFGFHALEALSDSVAPDLTLNQKLRLRASAVSLSREAHKARSKLDQLIRTRATASVTPEADAASDAALGQPAASPQTAETPIIPETPAGPEIPAPAATIDPPLGPTEPTAEPVQAHRNSGAAPTWKSYQQRRAAEKITENLRRNAAMAAKAPTIPPQAAPRPAAV